MKDRYQRILESKKVQNKEPVTSMKEQPKQENRVDHLTDPRPDLTEDHLFWVDLLINTKQIHPNAFGTLHGIRCSGARLAKTENGFKLLPGENSAEAWEETKQKWLAPIREQLKELFSVTRLGVVKDGELPEGAFVKQQSLRDAWLR